MPTSVIILLSVVILILVLLLGDFKLELRIHKAASGGKDLPEKTTIDLLSNTEMTILKLVSEGKTNQEIADQLFISVHTVKKHISNIFRKLNITSRTETRKYKDLIGN